MDLTRVKRSAQVSGWHLANIQPDKYYTRFTKGEKIFDVWHTGTVRYIPFPFAKAEHMRDNSEEDIEVLLEDL